MCVLLLEGDERDDGSGEFEEKEEKKHYHLLNQKPRNTMSLKISFPARKKKPCELKRKEIKVLKIKIKNNI